MSQLADVFRSFMHRNVLVIFTFSDVDTTPGEIHRKLLDHLANDYFIDSKSRNYRTWKIHFEKYRDAANNNEYSILQDFDHLKAQHDLEVGKYYALLDIFQHIDKRAVRRIEQDTEKIRCMLRNQKAPTRTYNHYLNNRFLASVPNSNT